MESDAGDVPVLGYDSSPDITALANALDVDPAYNRRILDLANLSPAFVEAIFKDTMINGESSLSVAPFDFQHTEKPAN